MATATAPQKAKKPSVIRRVRPTMHRPPEAFVQSLDAEARAVLQRRLIEPAECIFSPLFPRARSLESLQRTVSDAAPRTRQRESSSDKAPAAAGVRAPEILTADQERMLFLSFNYCRYRVLRIVKAHKGERLGARAARDLIAWERQASALRATILQANTSLVLAMARRSRNTGVELPELVSEGNLALLRCADKFDAGRGFKFSTYACRAILASFARAASKASRLRSVFPTSFDASIERSDFLERKRQRVEVECVDELRAVLVENSAGLSDVERRVLDTRFHLGQDADGAKRRTLDQVGSILGVSKERVRQIQNQALAKLRAVLESRLPAAG